MVGGPVGERDGRMVGATVGRIEGTEVGDCHAGATRQTCVQRRG
jgi:hypothetical protein